MAETIGELVYKITGDYSDLDKALDKASDGIGKFAKESVSDIKSANRAVSNFGSTFRTLTGLIGAKVSSSIFRDVINEAGELETAIRRLNVIYGDMASTAVSVSHYLADNYGMSKTAAASSLGYISNILAELGFANSEVLDMSTSIVKLGVDLRSMTGGATTTAAAVQSLSQALLGNSRAVRNLGIAITDSNLKELGAALGYDTSNMDATTKALLRYKLILEQTSLAQGNYIKNSDTYANIVQDTKAALSDLKVTIGEELLPVAKSLLEITTKLLNNSGLTDFISNIVLLTVSVKSLNAVYPKAVSGIGTIVKGVNDWNKVIYTARSSGMAFSDVITGSGGLTPAMSSLSGSIIAVSVVLAIQLIKKMSDAAKKARDLKSAVAEVSDSFTKYGETNTQSDFKAVLRDMEATISVYEKQQSTISNLQKANDGNKLGRAKQLTDVVANQKEAITNIALIYNQLDDFDKKALERVMSRNEEYKATVLARADELAKSATKSALAADAAGKSLIDFSKKTDSVIKGIKRLNEAMNDTDEEFRASYENILEELAKEVEDGMPAIVAKLASGFSDIDTVIEKSVSADKGSLVALKEELEDTVDIIADAVSIDKIKGMSDSELDSYFTSIKSKYESIRSDFKDSGLFGSDTQYDLFDYYIKQYVDALEYMVSAYKKANIELSKNTDEYNKKVASALYKQNTTIANLEAEQTSTVEEQFRIKRQILEDEKANRIANAESTYESLELIEKEYALKSIALEKERADAINDVNKSLKEAQDAISDRLASFDTGYEFIDVWKELGETLKGINEEYDNLVSTFGDSISVPFTQALQEIGLSSEQIAAHIAVLKGKLKNKDFDGAETFIQAYINQIKDPDLKAQLEAAVEELTDSFSESLNKNTLSKVSSITTTTITDAFSSLASNIGDIMEMIGDNELTDMKNTLAEYKDSYDKMQEAMQKKNYDTKENMTQDEKDAIERQKKLDEDELKRQEKLIEEQEALIEEEEKKQFERNKALAITQAIIDGIKAAMSAYAQGSNVGGPWVGAAYAAIASAFAGAQVAAIAAQPYPSYAVGAYELPQDQTAQVHKGEMIIPRPFAEEIRDNGGFNTGGDVLVNVYGATDDVTVEQNQSDDYQQLDIYLTNRVKQMVARGELDSSLQNRYTISRAGRRG